MKSILSALIFITAAVIFISFTVAGGAVKGKVTPADGAFSACAVSGTDSFKSNILVGAFEIKNLKAGTYRLIIEATPPYKNFIKDGIKVSGTNIIDVGEIVLEK